MDTATTKRSLIALGAIGFLFAATAANADFNLHSVTSAVSDVKKLLPQSSNSRSSASYIPPGMELTLSNGKTAKAYGSDCQPGERQPCASIKVANGTRQVLIVPDGGGKSIQERWTFKRLGNARTVAVRPDGTILEASIDE